MYHVAICDDDMLVRMLIRTAVERSGAECLISEFADGAELIDGYEGYDVLFLDIDMPVTDGLEAAAVIRKTDRAVRIIYVTGYEDYIRRSFLVHPFAASSRRHVNMEEREGRRGPFALPPVKVW